MEEVFDTLDCRLKVSGTIADLFMMEILKSAMDEAYGRICRGAREGRDLGRLNDRSRFCELAIIQLEWCLRFLQEEVDVYIVESGRERKRLLRDLADTRDRMQLRMEEIESDIREKDVELMRRVVVEVELRRELAMRDQEVRRLRARFVDGGHDVAHEECYCTNIMAMGYDDLGDRIRRQTRIDKTTTSLGAAESGRDDELRLITEAVLKESMGVAKREIGDQAEGVMERTTQLGTMMNNSFGASSKKTMLDERQWRSELEKAISDIAVRDQLTLLRHMVRQATDAIKDFESERSVKEEIDRTIFAQIIKDAGQEIPSTTSGGVVGAGKSDDDDMESVLTQLKHFSRSILYFETSACEKLGASMSRLGSLEDQINPLCCQVDSLKNKRMLYQKAFTRRCFDLQTAEAEVDLLGDEVDALQCLVGKIYLALQSHCLLFQHHKAMMDVLILLQRELNSHAFQ